MAYKHKHACRRKSHTKVAYTRVSKSMYVYIYIHIHHSYTLCMYIHIYICYYIYTYYYTYIYIYTFIIIYIYHSMPVPGSFWNHVSGWFGVTYLHGMMFGSIPLWYVSTTSVHIPHHPLYSRCYPGAAGLHQLCSDQGAWLLAAGLL